VSTRTLVNGTTSSSLSLLLVLSPCGKSKRTTGEWFLSFSRRAYVLVRLVSMSSTFGGGACISPARVKYVVGERRFGRDGGVFFFFGVVDDAAFCRFPHV
jgi:hypothetical protein